MKSIAGTSTCPSFAFTQQLDKVFAVQRRCALCRFLQTVLAISWLKGDGGKPELRGFPFIFLWI